MNKSIDNEYYMTQNRVEYHSKWDKGVFWSSNITNLFQERLVEHRYSQLFIPIKLNSSSAIDTLYQNPELNRLFSILIDSYDELPTRPDIAFDLCWRAFEIEMNLYKNQAWNKNSDLTTRDLIARICKEAISPLYRTEDSIKESINLIFENISIKSLSFCITRAIAVAELTVQGQNGLVVERLKSALGDNLWEDIKKKYFPLNGTISPQTKRKICFLLKKILNGETITLNDKCYTLDFSNRLEFLIGGILYTSRCERFHGDYFSPFKSDKATLKTFYDFYYQLLTTYTLFWCLLYKYKKYKGLNTFYTPLDIKLMIDENMERLKILPNM